MDPQEPSPQNQQTTTKKDSSLKKKTKTWLDYLHKLLRRLDLQR